MASYEDLDKILADRREAKKDALKAIAETGRTSGLDAGAEVLLALAKGRKTVSVGELRAAAEALRAKANQMRAASNAKIAKLGG